VTGAVAARKGLQDRREVFAALQKTALAVLRRLAGKGVARVVRLADGVRSWERTGGDRAARRSGRRVLPCQSPRQLRCGRVWAHLVRMSVKISPLDQRRVSSR
jgi:hypothetical protein